MNYNERLLFYLLRMGLETDVDSDFRFSEEPDWKFIFNMSSEQGVLAIVFDGVEHMICNNLIPDNCLPPHALKMQWAMNVMKIEDVYANQYRLGNELVDIFADNGIKTIVMKGIALAVMYPKANHRPCGDLDCFLMGDYDKGNKIAVEHGAAVDYEMYKHSHVMYKGFMVENHHVLTNIKGAERNKKFERELQKVLSDGSIVAINDTHLLAPCSLFNAIFLTVHAWQHFCPGEIGLRHICDWAMLMKYHCDDIDWQRFVEVVNIRDTKIVNFARCVSYIAHYYMAVPMPPIFNDCKKTDALSERVLRYIMYDHKTDSTRNPHYWRRKFIILFDRLKGNWKYKAFSDVSNLKVAYNLFYNRWCEKNPKL